MEPNGYIQGLTASLELSTSTPVPSRVILKGWELQIPIGSVTPKDPHLKERLPTPSPSVSLALTSNLHRIPGP